MFNQLSLFEFDSFGIACPVSTIKAIQMPPVAPQPVQEVKPVEKPFTIEPHPYLPKGFRVVLAPGLTDATPKNPCLSCNKGKSGRDNCSETCSKRTDYLETIGAGLISGINTEESGYGISM